MTERIRVLIVDDQRLKLLSCAKPLRCVNSTTLLAKIPHVSW